MSERWPIVKLSDVADLCLGKMLDANKNKGRPLPYLRNPNVRWFEVDTSDLRMMPFEEHEDGRYGLRRGDVVICEGGEAGRAAVWDGRIPNLKFQKAIHRVRPSHQLDARFLVHQLLADSQSGRLADYYTGATIKHLTHQDLARYRFPLPPLAEQRRIAEILDKADALRAKRHAALVQLDTLTQSIFLDMFGDPKKNLNRWPERSLAEIGVEFRYGSSNRSAADGKWTLRIPNVVGGSINLDDLKRVPVTRDELSRLCLQRGDLLFVRTNGNPDYVGRCAVYDPDAIRNHGFDGDDFIFASYLIRGRIKPGAISPDFLREYLTTREGRRRLRTRSKTSAGQYNINTQGLGSIQVLVPPANLQLEFTRRISITDVVRRAIESSALELDVLFASLQHRAFRGEL